MEMLLPAAGGLFLVTLTVYLGFLAVRETVTARAVQAVADAERAMLGARIAELAERRRREQEKRSAPGTGSANLS